ncbi:Acetyltransferase (GNAT) family protein [Glycomyces harbinensis]|uniref:Acetyltransferase (GNAT) family protein n=2 Tax=Glycomyces harbinensis TaxID=58114 RepID=A0A1G6VV97_9ACTN|nr:GNAT family N-acetyltransferase [Glycomyces harbinensis]SDD57519.1 Acetyltransferase (GNAT) family protein [Glycomyces harbinensis]
MVNLTLDSLEDVPGRCRACVFWELSPLRAEAAREVGEPALEKEAWLSHTLLEWGGCGRIAYEGEAVAGYVTYASPKFVPRSMEFPSGPVSPDAALLMTAFVSPAYAGTGLGRQLVQTVAADVARRGIYAIETFGDARGESNACLVPADFYRSVGFKTVRSDPRYPRLRLELRSAIDRSVEAEEAMELHDPVEWFRLDDTELEQFFGEATTGRSRLDRPGTQRDGDFFDR